MEEGTRCSRRVAPLRRGNGEVDRIRCPLCLNEDRLRAIRNYSTGAFMHGITGSALEKDNVVKHSKSDIHKKAVSLERQPTRTINEILRSTPIGRAVASASRSSEKERVSGLFEVAYMILREEMPFTKFPAIVELDKRHGVCVGQTYHTEHKCQEFVSIIRETMSDDLVQALRSCRYMSVLMDGSTDSSMTEKEPFYGGMQTMKKTATVESVFFCSKICLKKLPTSASRIDFKLCMITLLA